MHRVLWQENERDPPAYLRNTTREQELAEAAIADLDQRAHGEALSDIIVLTAPSKSLVAAASNPVQLVVPSGSGVAAASGDELVPFQELAGEGDGGAGDVAASGGGAAAADGEDSKLDRRQKQKLQQSQMYESLSKVWLLPKVLFAEFSPGSPSPCRSMVASLVPHPSHRSLKMDW